MYIWWRTGRTGFGGKLLPPTRVRFLKTASPKGYKCLVHDSHWPYTVYTSQLYTDLACTARFVPEMALLLKE